MLKAWTGLGQSCEAGRVYVLGSVLSLFLHFFAGEGGSTVLGISVERSTRYFFYGTKGTVWLPQARWIWVLKENRGREHCLTQGKPPQWRTFRHSGSWICWFPFKSHQIDTYLVCQLCRGIGCTYKWGLRLISDCYRSPDNPGRWVRTTWRWQGLLGSWSCLFLDLGV